MHRMQDPNFPSYRGFDDPDDELANNGQVMVLLRECIEANMAARDAIDASLKRLCLKICSFCFPQPVVT
jgi:hypothetical protein